MRRPVAGLFRGRVSCAATGREGLTLPEGVGGSLL